MYKVTAHLASGQFKIGQLVAPSPYTSHTPSKSSNDYTFSSQRLRGPPLPILEYGGEELSLIALCMGLETRCPIIL